MNLDLQHKLVKGAVCGGIAAGISMVVGDGQGQGRIFGMEMPASAAIGIASGLGSVSADLAHQLIFPYIPQSEQYAKMESAALAVGVSGAVTAYSLGAPPEQFWTTAAVGAGSNALADYATYGWLYSGSGHADSSFF